MTSGVAIPVWESMAAWTSLAISAKSLSEPGPLSMPSKQDLGREQVVGEDLGVVAGDLLALGVQQALEA